MTRSSRHKSYKQSKHSSKDYSDSEEDVKMKEKSSRDENLSRANRGSTSGEKRKISSQVREGMDGKDLRNGEASEQYVLSELRKEKANVGKERADTSVGVGDDRWWGYGEEKGDADKNVKKELNKEESSKIDSKLKESNSKGETSRIGSKIKRKRYENGSGIENKDDHMALLVVEKEESERKGESKRKSERDSSVRKEGKESKDKVRGSEKEKEKEKEKGNRVGEESVRGDAEVKSIEVFGQKQGSLLGDFSEERKAKRGRENTECPLQDKLRNPELEKELEKRVRRRKEGYDVRDKHYDDFKEIDEKLFSSRGDRAKDMKYREDRHKDGGSEDKYQKDGRHRDNMYSKSQAGKYREDCNRDARHRDDRGREDVNRDNRHGDENFRDNGEKDSKQKDDEYREGTARDIQNKDDKYTEDGKRGNRGRDDRSRGNIEKYSRRNDERYHEDGDKDDRHRADYREESERDGRYKEDKYREDIERDKRHKDSRQGDDFGGEDRLREAKYRDERDSRDYSAAKSDPKHSRDDGYGDDRRPRKLNAYDDSSKLGDQTARYKDDLSRRKTKDKADYDDIRSQNTKDKGLESEKSASSARIDVVTDRGRSISKNADVELTSNHSRRHSSPSLSSHGTRGPYRLPKQEDSKYYSRDYSGAALGALRVTPSRSMEKLGVKEDIQLGELSAERRLKLDIRSSPLQLVDKSPASSTDRRYFARSDVRQSLDFEESAKQSGALRDAGKEGRGRRELVVDILPGDELPQADADNLSVSSPFTRNSHLSNSFKSMQPPSLFRTGLESPLLFGSAEDDGRSKSNSHNRRVVNPNMGRVQGNALRGVPNWPSPLVNGFMPFPHGPPLQPCHSVIQQFHAPPIFGVRSSMELNHPSPYHMPDADRFSGPGHPMGWRNPVDSGPPPLYGWDGEDSQIYGRPDWDHSRSLLGSQGWEKRDLWKGPYKTASIDMPSSDKENDFSQIAEEPLVDQSIQQAKSGLPRHDKHAESADIIQSRDGLEKNASEAPNINPETGDIAKISRKDDACLCHFYFSKLDVAADLTESELLNKCTGFLDIDQSIVSDLHDSGLFYMEEADEASLYEINNFSLFSAANDSIFQKATSLYRRQKEDFRGSVMMESIPKSNKELNAEDNNTEKSPADNVKDVGNALPNSNGEAETSNSLQVEEYTMNSHLKLNLPVASVVEKSELVSTSNHNNAVDLALNQVPEECILQNSSSIECVEKLDGGLSAGLGEVHMKFASNIEELSVFDNKCGPVSNSHVSSEAMMPELIESAPVNLSRIHHSPESTH